MQAIFDMFDERKHEISLYLSALVELDQNSHNNDRGLHYFNNDFLKILRANTLVMVYNLVESTVMGGILEIYDKLRQEGMTYSDVRSEIQNIWFSYKFKQVYDEQAHFHSYKGKAQEIVNAIMTGNIIDLDRKATAISGNLDADQIRIVCQDHGIRFTTDPGSKGGVALGRVKQDRNNLAHGTLSFAECGRNYSIQDLEGIITETVLYLQGLLDGMKQYYDQQLYKAVI